MDIEAEREKITKEIKELERILDPSSSGIHVEVSESSLDSDSEADSLPCEDVEAADPPFVGEERWGEASNEEEDLKDRALPEDPETCLQLNMVYQEVIQEKLAEVSLLLAQNREQQEEILGDLAGSRGPRVKDGKSLPPNMYIGHFMKPYFKDKVTGVGPPANEETREKAAQGIKAFEQLLVTKWKLWEKALLRKSVVSDRLQRLLQPKLLKLEYLRQKQSRVSSEPERQVLEKQVGEAEQEIRSINQLPEEALLGSRLDSHDWEKISNVHFEGSRSAEEIRKFWQSFEHPSINKQEWSAEEVQRLKAIAATHGHLEWHLVAEELGTRRSAFQCLQKFQQHNKALKRTEWTEEEDHMLTQLVQEMRVGSHIPYRRIVYYMEGRDSMQLIYRWTKSLDPSLKRGSWAPEEDAKLLQAVAKYGEQDWFKIREEVPGRSDAQCRDRYLRRLHFSLKKGRWAADEEQRLRELIEKHGAGHWARIASELPHRSGSQCLSKWKAMAGKRQGQQRRRRRPCHRVRWSSGSSSDSDSGRSSSDSGSSSSSGSEGSEAELEEPRKGRGLPLPPQYVVPDIDLWVPARQSSESGLPPRGGAGSCSGRPSAPTGPPKGSDVTPGCDKEAPASALAAGELSQNLAPAGRPADSQAARLEEPACEQERLRQAPLPGSPPGPGPGDSTAGPHLRQLRHRTFQNGQRRRRRALQRRLLERRLLLAVTPWVSQGEVTLPCPPTPAAVHTRADGIRMQLENAHLASTPVFTLLIQLLQIDAKGCMEVVRERKAQPHALPQPGLRGPPPRPQQAPVSAQRTPGCPLPYVPAQGPGKSTSHRASPGLQPPSSRVPVPAPCGPRPKPKTVSELLREKRLREAHAKKAAQGPTVLRPPLLVSSPVILQPPLLPAPRGAPVGASPCPSGSCPQPGASAKDRQLPTPQALALSLTPGPSQGPVGCPPSGEGQPQAPAASLPEGLPLLPAAPSPTQPPARPCGLTPALGTPRAGSPLPASISLPVTWVLTAQGLLPVPVPAVVGLPGPGETPCPPGLPAALPPPPHGTHPCPPQPPAGVSAEPAPGSRTEPSIPPSRPPPQSAAEVGGDAPCAPGEVQVAGETPQPKTPSRAHCPGAEPPAPSQLPGHGGTGPRADPAGTPVSGPVPLGLEKPPLPGPEKGALALGLLSLGSEAAAREWLRGQRGVSVPPLGSRLPYQPPGLCSLRALATLLRHKKALEHQAAALVAGGTAGPGPGALQASLELVRGQLRDNPAFLLLKARFLAAFALPGLLATLAPRGVRTTLSAARRAGPESEDESEAEELGDRNGQPGCTASRKQLGPATASPPQGAVDPGEGPAPPCLDGPGDLDVLRTRHSRHPRRRRWPL